MKKISAVILIIISLISAFVSCKSDFEDITYREDGISFTLPNTMRKSNLEGYDLYFTNTAVSFAVKKIDEEVCNEISLKKDASAKEYVDFFAAKIEIDLEDAGYSYDDRNGAHSFKYIQSGEDWSLNYYIAVVGEAGNIWHIEMWCEETYYEDYLPIFGEWRRSISVYN